MEANGKLGSADCRGGFKRTDIQDDARELLRYQLRTLKRIKETNEAECDKDGKPRLIGKGDIDGIRDLFNTNEDKRD